MTCQAIKSETGMWKFETMPSRFQKGGDFNAASKRMKYSIILNCQIKADNW